MADPGGGGGGVRGVESFFLGKNCKKGKKLKNYNLTPLFCRRYQLWNPFSPSGSPPPLLKNFWIPPPEYSPYSNSKSKTDKNDITQPE